MLTQLISEIKHKVDTLMNDYMRLKQENEFLWKENSELKNTVFRLSELVQNQNPNGDSSRKDISTDEIISMGQNLQVLMEGMKSDIEYCLEKLNESSGIHE